ncbi:putative peptidoglycan D,D-transpeptidase FtsI [Pseudolycoriella hygida]|uniref:Peptidoglycan D,D-transpeptidase FtsI n=1 Tax=Pseudolycoriella hygida TaxID=35572 RepID=A0A9Q0MNQ1_9DIPT|nr:putative peptidoglycan D,D-transpeptidase FtsI [Pseudolycoriella hygida]
MISDPLMPESKKYAKSNEKVINPEQCLEKLSKILPEIDKTKLLAELKSNKSFVWVKRDLLPKEQEAILNLAMPGYVGRDLVGLAGLERSYDKFLTNSDSDLAQPDQLKKPLELSIDVRLQYILNEEMNRTSEEFRAIGAVGIIVNPNNGEILAMVSKPDFNPHYPSSAKPEELFNMASLGIYEMGSVFKTLTMAVGFDTDAIAMNDAYDISYMKVGSFNIKDYHPRHGWHSVPEIFLHSSNIGVSQIMLEIGKSDFKKYLKKLGLLDQLKIELPERGTPLFPPDKRWSDLTSVVMSYGYGISISPLHFIQAVLPVVNGGTLYDLTLIKRQDERLAGTRIFSEKTSKQMSELFRFVVKEGTGRRADVKGYLVGGKTGTAEKLTADGHGKRRYLKNSRMSSFLGLLPASNPQYVIFIMFDEPKGTKESFGFATAGWTAAPTVGRVLERMVSLYGIEPVEKGEEL